MGETKGLGTLLVDSFSLFTKNIVRLLILAFFSFLCCALAVLLPLPAVLITAFITQINIKIFISVFLFLSLFLTFIGFYLLFCIAQIKMLQKSSNDETIGIFDLCRESKVLVMPMLTVCTLVIVKVLLWGLLFVIPGIIFGVLYYFSHLALILDGKTGIQALRYSKELIKSNAGKFFGNSMVVVLILIAVNLGIDSLAKFIFGVNAHNNVNSTGLIMTLPVNMIAGTYGMVFSYLLYNELKNRMQLTKEIA